MVPVQHGRPESSLIPWTRLFRSKSTPVNLVGTVIGSEGSWLLLTRINEPNGHGSNGCWALKTWVPPARAHWVTNMWGNENCMTGHWGQACISILKYADSYHGCETWGFYWSVLPYKPGGVAGGLGCKVEYVVIDGVVLVAQVWVKEPAPKGWIMQEQYWNPQQDTAEGLSVYGRMERKARTFTTLVQAKQWAKGLVQGSILVNNAN